MAETEAKLNLSLDDIISKTAKSSRPAGRGAGKPAGGRSQRNGTSKSPAGGAKARALGVAVGRTATKRQGAAPRRGSTGSAGAGRRQIVIDSHDDRMLDPVERISDPARPRLQAHTQMAQVRAALDGSGKWQHDKFEGGAGGGGRAGPRRVESGHKLVITNLDYKVSDEDIQELFGAVGDSLKSAKIIYDNSGRSEETAEVVYMRKPDALAAIKKYQNISLDGKPMHIELVASGAGRVVERLSSGTRLGDRLGGRVGGGNVRGRGAVTAGSGNLRSAQGGGRRGRGRNTGGDFMEE